MSVVDGLADSLGLPHAAFRLFVTVLAGWPTSFIYRSLVEGSKPVVQHAFFTLSGAGLLFFCYGTDIWHVLMGIAVTYAILFLTTNIIKNRVLGTALVFLFAMGYLLYGYAMYSTLSYDIDWTMPFCVLALRVISLAFDIQDGALSEEKKSADQKEISLRSLPNVIEVFGYCLFFGGVSVGPQFPFHTYSSFVNGTLYGGPVPAGRTKASLQRYAFGLLYALGANYFLSFAVPESSLFSASFLEESFWYKMAFIFLHGKFVLMKYVGVWLLNEAAGISCGISYNGKDERGVAKWDGLANADLYVFETSTSLQGVIKSFNINTNQWVMRYVYKRLRFLNNKHLSSIGAMFFLAIWHGYHPGYFMTFALEFFCMIAERALQARVQGTAGAVGVLVSTLGWFSRNMICNYALVSFIAKDWARSIAIYQSVYFAGHVAVFGIIALSMVLPRSRRVPRADKAAAAVPTTAPSDTKKQN